MSGYERESASSLPAIDRIHRKIAVYSRCDRGSIETDILIEINRIITNVSAAQVYANWRILLTIADYVRGQREGERKRERKARDSTESRISLEVLTGNFFLYGRARARFTVRPFVTTL